MADKLKKNQRILNSDWDDETLSYREKLIERQRLEDEKRAQEERVRKEQAAASLDSFGSMQGMKQALDTPSPEPAPVEDTGYSIWDVGVSARQGAAAVTKGALGLPVNAANLIAAPFMDSPFQQPEFVRDMRGIIDEQQQEIYDRQASDKLKSKNQQFQEADGLWEAGKFAATNPGWLGLQAFQQGPQVIASGPGGVAQKVVTGALNAAGQSEEAVATELRKQGLSEEEIAKRSASAFASSLALNAATPYALKSTFLEGLVARQAKNRVTNGVIKDALGKVSRETAEGIITEVGDQYIQNINSGKDPGEGLAQAAVLGAAFSAAVTGPTATIESAAEAGRAASKLQTYLKDQKFKKEATDLFNQTKPAPTPNTGTFGEQGDLFGGGGTLSQQEDVARGTAVGTDSEGNQGLLRTQAATIRTQLEQDRARLNDFQTRIERAPFAEEGADLLTNQETTDMSRIQQRIAVQERALAEVEAAIVPIQPELPLPGRAQPKNPKFRGDERTVDQVKSDYFKTQPVQGPAPMSPELRKEAQRAKVEELKRSKKEVTDADKKAKAQYEAARRKYLDGVRAGLMDLDPDTRASRLAEAAVAWKVDNPLVLPSKQAPTTTTTPAQNQTAAPVEGEATVPVTTLDDTLKNAPESSVALPNAAPQGSTGVTLDDVSRAVGGGKMDKLASRLSYMVEDGNLEIVQDQSDIAGQIGRMKQQGKGWYDPETGKTYLVASNLDSKNTRGDILATLAHETKHGADFGGSKGLARSFKSFVGAEANAKMAAKIRAAAKAGDKSAQYAVSRVDSPTYQGLGLSADQTGSEIVANYISAESKKSGVTTSLYRGIVSPLRAGAKKLLGVKDVSLGDIHYMADSLVGEVAARGERVDSSTGVALPMVLGFSANNFQDAQDAGRVFQSRNGNYKFVISDKDSTLQQGAPARLVQGEALPLGEVINHPELYDNYVGLPQAIDVKVDPELKGSATKGYWDRNKFTISVSPEAASDASTDSDNFRGLILHEVQHAIQDVEGHPRGGNSDMFKDTPDYDRVKTSRDNTRRLTSALLQGIVHPQLSIVNDTTPTTTMNTIKKLVEEAKKDKSLLASNAKQVASLLEDGVLNEQTLGVISKLNELGNKLELADNAVLTKDNEAFNEYWNLYGEEEARFTQDNRNASLEELPINPEEFMGYGATATYDDNDSYLPLAELAHSDPKIVPTKKAINQIDTLLKQARDNLRRAISLGDKKQIAESTALVERLEGMLEQTNKKLVPMPNAVEQTEQDNRTWGEKKKDSNAFIRVIDDLLSTTEGFGVDMFKLLDARQGLRGDFSLRAETAGSKMEQGIRDAAKNRGTTINKISGELETKLKEINKLDTKEQREAAVKALDKDYPGVGTALNELRNLKWAFARKIVEQRRAQGTDLTPKEQNIYGAIIQNAETYTTRAYVSNQMPGKKFAKRRLKEIKNNPTGEEATKYNEAIQFIIDNHLAIPSKADLQALKGGEVRRFYESWFGNSDGVDVETMVDKLDSIPRKDREAHNAKAEEIAKELMGFKKTRGTVAKGYAGARQNRTILEGRENVPDEIRYLMGEITNPLAAEMMSIARLINLYTQTNMLQNFAAQGKDRWYKDYNSGDFSIQLTSDAYGPMKGKFVTPSAAKFLEPAVTVGLDLEQALGTSAKDIGELAKITANAIKLGAQKATGLVKMVDLVTSPAAMVWNYIGAYGIVAQNGANPKYIAKAQRATLLAIKAHYGNTDIDESKRSFVSRKLREAGRALGIKPIEQAEIQELIRSRVLDSATVGEYQQSFYDNMFRFLEDADTETGGKNLQLKLARAIKDGSMVARDAYAFMDMWAKVAAFYDRKDYLTKFYEANGDKVDNEAIIREAGQDITAANISYTRAVKAIKILERNVPMFTMYLTYFSEVPRSLVFSAALAGKDFIRAKNAKTPQAKSLANGAGLRRTAGTLAMTAALASVINYYLDGLGDDEERRRKTDPDWEERGVPVPLGKTKDGKMVAFNLLRADPNGPLTEFMVHLANMDENDDLTDVLAETFKNQFVQAKPVMATLRLISGLAGRETTNYEDDHGAFYDMLDSYSIGKDTNLGRNLAAVIEGFTPRVIKGTYRSIQGRIGNRGYEFDPIKEPDIALAQAVGITPSVRDPEFSLGIAAGNYKKAKKEANETLGTLKSRYSRMDGSALIKELADIVESEEKAYRDLYEVYDGTKAFNGYYTDKDYAKAANAVIKDEKLGPAASDIANGSFNVRFISRKFLNEWRDARISKIKEMKSDKEKSAAMAALRNDYRMVADYLGGQRKE